MNCQEALGYLQEFLDHELDEEVHADVRSHLKDCPTCWRKFEFEQELRAIIWAKGQADAAPAHVLERVRRNVFLPKQAPGERLRVFPGMPLRPAWIGAALLCVLVTIGIVWMSRGTGGRTSVLLADLVGDHIAYAASGKSSEIISSDNDDVEMWLEGKLGYAINVPDFPAPAVKLLGGRIIDIEGRKVAYLFLQENQHALSLYIARLPEGDLCAEGRMQLQDCRMCLPRVHDCEFCLSRLRNFNVLSWQEEGLTYAMVSDLDGRQMLNVTCPQSSSS